MKKFLLCLSAFAVLAFLSIPASAQIPYRTMSQLNGDLSTACAAGNITYQLVIVTDAGSSTDCSTGSGDGTTPSVCWCIDGAFAALSAATSADLAGYVLITKAGQQSITASGAGNDVTLVAADDVLMTPGDDFTVTPTAGSVFLNAVGAGEDITLTAADDLLIQLGTDANASYVMNWGAGTNNVTVDNGGWWATVTNTTSGWWGASVYGDASVAGEVTLSSDADSADLDIYVTGTDGVTSARLSMDGAGPAPGIGIQGGADATQELYVSEGVSKFVGMVQLTAQSAPPAACAAGTKGGLYVDSDVNELCICNGTSWLQVDDMATGCS